jgi:hypothetical protein
VQNRAEVLAIVSYPIFFHHGAELGVQTKVQKGRLHLDDHSFVFRSSGDVTQVSINTIRSVSMFRLHGLSRVIRVDHDAGSTFLAVTRLMIGQFAFVNFFKTGALFKKMQAMVINTAA